MDRKLVEQAVPTYNSLRNDLIKHDIEQSYEKLKKAGSEMEVKKGGGGLPPEEPNAGAEEEASKCTEEEISADCNGRRMWEVGFYRLPKSRHTRLHCLFPVSGEASLNSKLRDHTRNGSRFHIRFATLVDSSIHAAPPASFHGHQLRGGKVYHDWAMSTFPNGFHTGDSLDFVYESGQNSVMQVTVDDYNTCNTMHPIQSWTNGPGAYPLQGYTILHFIS
ncbi:unnamed protein product [Sphagnum jensenii]|uniref:Phytocyanin domain-containing protein n=1 Tax=Sphagnum jensenii TaxID=128206 RepID=A0ABP0X5A1_9BRYO